MLQSVEIRRARHVVGEIAIAKKDFGQWTDTEYEAVRTASSTYDVAGMLVRAEMVDRSIILSNWGPSIRVTYSVAAPMIAARRRHFGSETYWDDFEWLAKQTDNLL
jgi:hypothetical protein